MSFAYSADGSRLYALVQSPAKLLAPSPDEGNTNLAGIYVSRSGSQSRRCGSWDPPARWQPPRRRKPRGG